MVAKYGYQTGKQVQRPLAQLARKMRFGRYTNVLYHAYRWRKLILLVCRTARSIIRMTRERMEVQTLRGKAFGEVREALRK